MNLYATMPDRQGDQPQTTNATMNFVIQKIIIKPKMPTNKAYYHPQRLL